MVVAIVVHAALFLLWPRWEIDLLQREVRSEMVQVEPLALHGVELDGGESVLVIAEEPEANERDPQPIEDSGIAEETDLADLDRLIVRNVTGEIVTVMAAGPAPDLAALILETLVINVPNPASDLAPPVIRNPTVLTRFFRSKYNPIRPAVEGFVSIAMWIDERGLVGWTEVQESSGNEDLDRIALEAFKDVVSFMPAQDRNGPIATTMVISVPFNSEW